MCGLPARRARGRKGRGRYVDVKPNPRNRAQQQRFEVVSSKNSPARGRSVDAAARSCRSRRQRKELISRNFLKPSDGLEPSTPSLPRRGSAARYSGQRNGGRLLGQEISASRPSISATSTHAPRAEKISRASCS